MEKHWMKDDKDAFWIEDASETSKGIRVTYRVYSLIHECGGFKRTVWIECTKEKLTVEDYRLAVYGSVWPEAVSNMMGVKKVSQKTENKVPVKYQFRNFIS